MESHLDGLPAWSVGEEPAAPTQTITGSPAVIQAAPATNSPPILFGMNREKLVMFGIVALSVAMFLYVSKKKT